MSRSWTCNPVGAFASLPEGQNVYFEPLDPGKELMIPLQAYLPEGYQEGKDVIKVFATLGSSNFRVLELPDLDKPIQSKGVTRGGDALDQLLGAFAAEQPPTSQSQPGCIPDEAMGCGAGGAEYTPGLSLYPV